MVKNEKHYKVYKYGFTMLFWFCPSQRPNVLLAVGELFVRARSAHSLARSACVIVRRRRVSVRPKAERFARRRRALCPGVVRREAPVLLAAVGGFPFGRRSKVFLAVGQLFVRVRSARSQARSACVIARRRRFSIRPKAEGFARRRRALCSSAKSP